MALATGFEPKPFGRYVLIEKLAVGGMAEIYKAKTYGVDGFEKQLAVKRILPHCAADKEFITMLIDEAKLTVLLSHANIVQVFDLGKVGDDYFISMEFIHGTNLREVMGRYKERSEKIGEDVAVYLTSEVCKGLDYAHRKTDGQGGALHIVHRDISPQNILISYEGEVKIVDFGIAKAAMNISHTMTGVLKGKIAYMSPEQALGKPINHQTDIFSTGLVLYELLTGAKLFTGETQFEVLNRIRTTRVLPDMLPEGISGPLKAILAKGLAFGSNDRYQTAADFQLDLTKYLYTSFADFSPRLFSANLGRLFEQEIKKKEPTISIDEGTRSGLAQQASRENIVVRGLEPTDRKIATSKAAAMTGVTAPTLPRIGVARYRKSVAWGTAALALAVVGYLGATRLWTPESEETPIEEAEKVPPVTAPAIDTATLPVATEPAGARIFVNDTDTGLTTPASVPKLALGEEYRVRLVKENFEEVSRTVPITSQTPPPVIAALKPLPKGVIAIASTPAGARIFVDNTDTGLVTPTRIENLEIPKTYALKLSLPDHGDWLGSVEVKNFEPVALQAMLTPGPKAPEPTQPAATKPAELTFGGIQVTSVPTAAQVFVNGRDSGRQTPTTLSPLEDGKRVSVLLKKEGYEDFRRTMQVVGNKTTPLVASLKKIEIPEPSSPEPIAPQPATPEPVAAPPPEPVAVPPPPPEPEPARVTGQSASLSLKSEPDGAEVYINAEYKGTTPVKVEGIEPGRVRLVVNKEGFLRHVENLTLTPGESRKLKTIALGSLYGEVSIKSTPARAEVVFDGEAIGARTPVTIRRVPRDKTHSVRVTLNGYRPWESSFDMNESDTKRYDVVLEKQ